MENRRKKTMLVVISSHVGLFAVEMVRKLTVATRVAHCMSFITVCLSCAQQFQSEGSKER